MTIHEIAWSSELEPRLAHPAIADVLDYLRAEVERGESQLWHCVDDKDEAYMVTRLDHNPTEWVVCYFIGSGLRKFGKEVIAVASRKGWRVRAHTTQRGVARMLEGIGLIHREIVLRS